MPILELVSCGKQQKLSWYFQKCDDCVWGKELHYTLFPLGTSSNLLALFQTRMPLATIHRLCGQDMIWGLATLFWTVVHPMLGDQKAFASPSDIITFRFIVWERPLTIQMHLCNETLAPIFGEHQVHCSWTLRYETSYISYETSYISY